MARPTKADADDMGAFFDRVRILGAYFSELYRNGRPPSVGPLDHEVLFVIDGVGGFQAAGLAVRRALRLAQCDMGTVLFYWQTPIYVDIFSDLMRLRRNRLMGARLARTILTFQRAHPTARVHVMAYSGGAGIAVFALERLIARSPVETLVLACPALSPMYNLGPALRAVDRAYALVSSGDRMILGLGTRLFGTTDRVFSSAGGRVGFRLPDDVSTQDREAYARLREFRWSPDYRCLRHHGTHSGWASVAFLREHLAALLHGEPRLPLHEIAKRA